VAENEQIGRPDAEHDGGVPVEAIGKPPPPRSRLKLIHGQRVDVADAAAVEIAGTRVMKSMGAPPELVGRQGQHADHAPDPIIRQPAAKERPVAAIMLDHEEADEEARRRYGEQHADPIADIQRRPHQRTDKHERPCRDDQFEYAARAVRFPISGEGLHQCSGIRQMRIWFLSMHAQAPDQMRQAVQRSEAKRKPHPRICESGIVTRFRWVAGSDPATLTVAPP
jgi:hypothetical protein